MWSPNTHFVVRAFALLLGCAPITATATDDDMTAREQTDVESSTGTLIVHIEGLRSGDGNLSLVLFDSKENFLKHPVRAEVFDIVDLQSTWIIEQLAYGTYAVLAHHDINASGTMERHWYGKPKEPTGTSNDAPAKFGPPKFKNAKFQLESPTLTITVTIK